MLGAGFGALVFRTLLTLGTAGVGGVQELGGGSAPGSGGWGGGAAQAQAVVIAKDRRTGALCSRIGPGHLMVAPGDLPAFRTALLKLGWVLPARP